MADERSRAEIAQTLTEHLGSPVAAALLEAIPSFGWHEIATKPDLRALQGEMAARFDLVDGRFGLVDDHFSLVEKQLATLRVELLSELRGGLDRQTGKLVRWTAATVLTAIGAVGGAIAGIAALAP